MNTPKLRFKEFSGEWSLMTGDKIFETISDKKHNSDLPILAITQEQGAIPREFINYKISVTEKSVDSYKVVQKGDFIISLRSFQGGIEYSEYQGICSPAYIILRNKIKIDDAFYKTYFKTDKYILKLNAKLEGIRDGKMISYKYFSEIKLPYPTLPEQQKIASFFTAVDQKLTVLKKKKELLEQYKKGVMQQIFSQKLRFKDENGNPFPEWEEKTLGKIAQIYQPKTISQNEFSENGFDVYGANGIIGKYKEYNHLNSQIVVTCRGNTCGTINYTKPKSWITGNAMVINLDSNLLIKKKFLYYQLKNANLNYLITGSGQPQITGSIKMHKILIACYLEQQKIADFLSAIDNKIDTVAKQIDKTEQWKKGLLQKMFV